MFRKLHLTAVILLVMVFLLGAVSAPAQRGEELTVDLWSYQPALAAELTENVIYLPAVKREIQTVFGVGLAQITTSGGFDYLTQTKASWTRKDGIRWNEVETVEGIRNWAVLDELNTQLRTAARNNIRVILIIQGTPAWAAENPNLSCGPIRTDKFQAFASFLSEVVRRYSLAPYYVKDFEIWNEPDLDPADYSFDEGFGCWGDRTDPYYGGRHYGEMLKVVYPAMKSANPQARVVLGGLLLDCHPDLCPTNAGHGDLPPKFLEGVLVVNAGNSFDGVSFHAYDYYMGTGNYGNTNWGTNRADNGPVSIAKAAYIRQLLFDYKVNGKFLMNTESALLCDEDCGADFEATKASYVVQANTAALSQGFETNLWYSMLGWRNSGLLTSTLQPRDAFFTFKFATEKLSEAQYVIKLYQANLDGYEFLKRNRRILVVWSKTSASFPFSLDKTPLSVFDAFGNPLPTTLPIQVGQMPVYIELSR